MADTDDIQHPQTPISQIPTPNRSQKCPYCTREFQKADHFHRHIRSHTKEKPFRCQICRKAFPRHDTLLRHTRTHQFSSDRSQQPKNTKCRNRQQSLESDSLSADALLAFAAVSTRPKAQATNAGADEHYTPRSDTTRSSFEQGPSENVLGTHVPSTGILLESTSQQIAPAASTFTASILPQDGCDTRVNPVPGAILSTPAMRDDDQFFIPQSSDFGIESPHLASLAASNELNSAHWLLEDDFDLAVFDNMGFGSVSYAQAPLLTHDPDHTLDSWSQSPGYPEKGPVLDLRRVWYTQMHSSSNGSGESSGTATPAVQERSGQDDIDENYRVNMAKQLRPPVRDDPLPSIDFMNLCIHLFFTRFNVALPLVHSGTFRPTRSNALLVLSICSAGCLSMGSEMAADTGSMLFERVNKAILAHAWERLMPQQGGHTQMTSIASIIGQTFALLSADPAHRATAAAFHGSMIAVARHHKLLKRTSPPLIPDNLTPKQLDGAWRSWAKEEELRRLAFTLYLHDAELAALFHHEPVFRHNVGTVPTISSSELFFAPSAAAWLARLRNEQQQRTSMRADVTAHISGGQSVLPAAEQPSIDSLCLDWQPSNIMTAYNSLSGMSASISECRHLNLLSANMRSKFESDLLTWHTSTPNAFKVSSDPSTHPEAPFSLLPLWHHTFMALTTDFSILELAIGKEGTAITPNTREYVQNWLASIDSKRCLWHALCLQNLMVSSRMGSLAALHTPRILFSAAICWYCYMLYLPDASANPGMLSSSSSSSSSSSTNEGTFQLLYSLPEAQLLRQSRTSTTLAADEDSSSCKETISSMQRILTADPSKIKASTLCVIECILRRLGTSGISIRFADIIQMFIFGESPK